MVLCSPVLGRELTAELVVVVSNPDPVADAVATEWGTLPVSEGHVDGATIRRLNERVLVVRRPGPHIHDEDVDLRFPATLREARPTLVFPSIHRSERNVASLTVHPLGNPGPRAELGGRPRTLVPTDPRRMARALRLLDEGAATLGMGATYEATHHGPAMALPSFFIEIGYGALPHPPAEAVRLLADVIPRITSGPGDRVALGVGGGHYVPHFTDLALRRSWAFGHILSRHALEELDRATAVEAYARTEGAEGVVYARAEDARHPALEGVGPRLRDQDAPPRERGPARTPTGGVRSASGT
ncbi:MAG TPA: D-aminoacyl-tRNA deacylase [Thermoplasmata archaeon]|jgi:D-aminoacyl-tRNA deacylase